MDGRQMPVAAAGISVPASEVRGPSPAEEESPSTRPDGQGPIPARAAVSWPGASWALRASILPWVLARVVVGVALAVAHELAGNDHLPAKAAARVHEGLLGWDAGWYEAITRQGYWGAGHTSLRFFPLFPVLARAVSSVPGIGAGAAVVVVANASALVGTAGLVALVRWETGNDGLARRAAWLVCLAPAAFTFVMGYAEGTLLVLTTGTFLALRARRWWWAAALGLAAGLTRPFGALLFVPAAVEAWRAWGASPPDRRIGAGAAVVAPVVGTVAFLGWVGWRYHDVFTPLRLQVEPGHRGRLADPFVTLAHDASYLVHGHHLGEGLHLPWVLVSVALLVVTFRRWPACYGAFALAVLAIALTGSNLDSFERYALSAFPLVLAAATLTSRERVFRAVLVVSAAGLVGYGLLAFVNLYVP